MQVHCGTCGKKLERAGWEIRRCKRHFCNRECWRLAPDRATAQDRRFYRCPRCREERPREEFVWETVSSGKRQGKPRRRGYCRACEQDSRKEYHEQHRPQARDQHARWRERCLAEGGDKALRWYFQRHLGSYRKRTRSKGIPQCDLSEEWLVGLFHQQGGRCFYTGVPLVWNTYGVGKGGHLPDSMSVDRRDPLGGYTKDNVVLCAYLVNTLKRDLPEEAFYALCQKILDTRAARNSTG